MIGTGVFTSTGFSGEEPARSEDDPARVGRRRRVALCGAACYAELGTMMPRAGGEYVYLREAYHPALGFMSGWVSLTAGFSAPIASAALVVRGVRLGARRTVGSIDIARSSLAVRR